MGYKELLNKYNRLEADFIELVMKSEHGNGCFDNNNKGFEWRGNI